MPKIKLTPSFINSVSTKKPKEKYQDATQSGLVLRVTPNSKVYYFVATITIPNEGKRQIEKKIGRVEDIPLSAARERARTYLSAYISQSSDPLFSYTKQKTVHGKLPKLSEVFEKWIERHKKQKGTSTYSNMYNGYSVLSKTYEKTDARGKKITLVRSLAGLRIDEITAKKISIWQRDMLEEKGCKPSSINRVCLELKHLLQFAIDEGMTDDNYQIPQIQKLSEREIDPKTNYFTEKDIQNLLNGIDRYVHQEKHGGYDMSYIHDIMIFLLETGMRPATVVGLEWRDIDFGQNRITLRASNIKTKQTDTCTPSKTARAILERRFREHPNAAPEDKVFTNFSSNMVCKKIKKVLRYIFGEDTKFSAYSFRHTFATYMTMQTEIAVVARAMNHKKISTTMKYVTVDAARVSEAVNKLPFQKKEQENATNKDKREE